MSPQDYIRAAECVRAEAGRCVLREHTKELLCLARKLDIEQARVARPSALSFP